MALLLKDLKFEFVHREQMMENALQYKEKLNSIEKEFEELTKNKYN